MRSRLRTIQEVLVAVVVLLLFSATAAIWIGGGRFAEAMVPWSLGVWAAWSATPQRRPA